MTCSFAQKILARANPAGVPQPIWSMLPPMVFRWESLTANALTIVALGEQELLSGVALILPPAKAVIAIADSVPCTAEVVLACESLKTAGYRLALAGWTGRKEQGPLAAMADFLLVGMRRLATVNERETKRGQADGKTALIAQNVDSWEEHKRARNLGFRFFQGDFFLTPQLFQARDYRHAAQRNAPAAGNSEGSPGPGANRGGGAR